MFAFKEFDGSQVWRHSFANLSTPSTNPPAYANGKVFISAGSQESTAMFAFDEVTGVQKYFTKLPQYNGRTPAVDGAYA